MRYLLFCIVSIFCVYPLSAQTFSVQHEKRMWRDKNVTLEITKEGIVYRTDEEADTRTWKYEDIQYFDRISEKEFTILTYEDQSMLLGRDRQYHFVITEGTLTDEIFRDITARMKDSITNRIVREVPEVEFEVAVKHLHTVGGCEGILRFTSDRILYATEHKKDAREWVLTRDVQSVWSMDRHHLEVHVYDNNRRQFSRNRTYRFDLKHSLDPKLYRALKLKLFELEKTHLPLE